MKKNIAILLIFVSIVLVYKSPVFSWSDHSLVTYQALFNLEHWKKNIKQESIKISYKTSQQNLAIAREKIQVRSLESFLQKNAKDVEQILANIESWAIQNVAHYKPLPLSLRFQAKDIQKDALKKFFYAIRINPTVKIHYYIMPLPGDKSAPISLVRIDPKNLSIFKNYEFLKENTFIEVKIGSEVDPLDVIAAASDEPDYGMDCDLWQDNPSEFSKKYGWGRQPFGNPNFEYATQAPFHMGFFHESWIIGLAAPYLLENFPEYRIYLFQELARLAFQRGEKYWGYRFLGWSLHYTADLVQPFHATILPGSSAIGMLWISIKEMLGYPEDKNNALTLVSNRHLAYEELIRSILVQEYKKKLVDPLLLNALRGREEKTDRKWTEKYPRMVIAREANARADKLDEWITKFIPQRYVNDVKYNFKHSPHAIYEEMSMSQKEALTSIRQRSIPLMESLGHHLRVAALSVLPNK